jgi:hypothetical protein
MNPLSRLDGKPVIVSNGIDGPALAWLAAGWSWLGFFSRQGPGETMLSTPSTAIFGERQEIGVTFFKF